MDITGSNPVLTTNIKLNNMNNEKIVLGKQYTLDMGQHVTVIPKRVLTDGIECEYVMSTPGRKELIRYNIWEMNGFDVSDYALMWMDTEMDTERILPIIPDNDTGIYRDGNLYYFSTHNYDCNNKVQVTEMKARATIEKILEFCKDFSVTNGEVLLQDDSALIEAPNLIADILDDILKIETEWAIGGK